MKPHKYFYTQIIKTVIKLSEVTGFEINIQMSVLYTAETKQITRKWSFGKSFAITVMKCNLGIKPRKFDSKPHIVRVTFLSTFDVPIKRTVISDKSDYL